MYSNSCRLPRNRESESDTLFWAADSFGGGGGYGGCYTKGKAGDSVAVLELRRPLLFDTGLSYVLLNELKRQRQG